ncbi:TIGR04104 family putative zinc finger protein [Clostridium sp. IBUN22A]|uniref:TIGR04104 family putative zinc finger protein n=1 Tax=Clostridium sp. IBUN22A TaxID=1523155 RepID=UPI0005FB8CC7|nr:TIGR04104 family putative zinc finger protein [Clostridium sp. IBUN22A]
MKYCPNCGSKFLYKERLKSWNRQYNEIHCSSCSAEYKKNNRIATGLSVFISCFISLIINFHINLEIEVYVIKLALVAVIAFISCFIILYLLNLFIKYERVK